MSHFTIVTNPKWLISTTHKGEVHVFGHRMAIHPRNLEFLELGFLWSDWQES